MLVIRLKRIGRKNKPYFRIVVQEKTKAPSSSVVEKVGTMDPHTDPATITLDKERIEYWLGHGAQPSATVHNLLINEGIIKGKKMRVVQPKIKKNEGAEEEKKEEKPAEEVKEEPKKE
ncbi:MAG: 30S ribosomal protein S16 [Patescibacteria group bacterium]|nr:30S ribosomal protein S16 [Patescibacteria group bacterium]